MAYPPNSIGELRAGMYACAFPYEYGEEGEYSSGVVLAALDADDNMGASMWLSVPGDYGTGTISMNASDSIWMQASYDVNMSAIGIVMGANTAGIETRVFAQVPSSPPNWGFLQAHLVVKPVVIPGGGEGEGEGENPTIGTVDIGTWSTVNTPNEWWHPATTENALTHLGMDAEVDGNTSGLKGKIVLTAADRFNGATINSASIIVDGSGDVVIQLGSTPAP